ncbi:uncharacterized protein [Euwallacea fornicatus]|uniref:uncharacterized protein n=1 Tax=Euwallacea fornicatus TaxID=995702 RepID=UPI0033904653
MVSNKTTKKKKPIETTLGKSQANSKLKEDVSHLRKPIQTSISGIKQTVTIWESATQEVKDLLMYECDIMFECKICRTIFRSLANFLLHKREYCIEKFLSTDCLNNNSRFQLNLDPIKNSQSESSSLGKVIEKLNEIGQIHESTKELLTVDLSLDPGNDPVKSMEDCEVVASNCNGIILENIDGNTSGLFQTFINGPISHLNPRSEFMKSEVMENHKKIENDVPILDAEGKICNFTSSKQPQPNIFPKSELKCIECNNQFATQKSLTNHIKMVHNPSRILYVCPTCKEFFANPWCVYRHLLKVHRLTNKQVRKMREQVNNNWVRRDEVSALQKKKVTEVNQIEDRDNQWINDIEGDKDFQMCAGCGKHFERKAALHSHSQMCVKRLEVIKGNAKKKDEEEAVEKARLDKQANDKVVLKGAKKRKGLTIWDYRRKAVNGLEKLSDESLIVDTSYPFEKFSTGFQDLVREERTDWQSVSERNMSSIKLEKYPVEINSESSTRPVIVSGTTATISFASKGNQIIDQSTDSVPSPSSSCQIISRSNSVDEAICVSSSDESEQQKGYVTPTKLGRTRAPGSPQSCKSSDIVNKSSQNGKSIFETPTDLLSSEVSFETFCKRVVTFEVENASLKKGKRKIDLELGLGRSPLNSCTTEDDVIFVEDSTFKDFQLRNSKNLSDLSNLSYNNPLKAKVNELQEYVPNEKKMKTETQGSVKSEINFLPRASLYMDREMLLCIPCGLTFKSFSLLLWHMSAHFSWFRFQCGKCSFVTFNKLDCTAHVRKDHKLKASQASSCVLPLPSWKTILMSHEYKSLDSQSLKGRHTDEHEGMDEVREKEISDHSAAFQEDGTLLEENSSGRPVRRGSSIKIEAGRRFNKRGTESIDVKEAGLDLHKLPEPVELAMPADVSEVFRTLRLEQDPVLAAKKGYELFEQSPDESNNDWSLSKECKKSVVQENCSEERVKIDVTMTRTVRPSRIRTKTKQDDNFLYYDSNVSKIADSPKNSGSKTRTENPIPTKVKISGKSVPVTQKRKS